MPQSFDDPPSAPLPSVESEAPSTTAPDDIAEGAGIPGPSLQEGEIHPPRRRRRRRRRAQSAPLSQRAAQRDEPARQETPPAGEMPDPEAPPVHEAAPQEVGGAAGPKAPRRRRRRRRTAPYEGAVRPEFSADTGGVDPGASRDATAMTPEETPTSPELSPEPAAEPVRPRRNRWRRPPRRTGLAEPDSGKQTQGEAEQTQPGRIGSRTGRPRHRTPNERRANEGGPHRGLRQPREGAARPNETSLREPGRRNLRAGQLDRRDRGSKGRSPGRGREAPPRKPEQKLYALESVVDRGFEDITDDTGEGGTRRIHWTIVKRTVADQKSGKAMSAAYVLQRDGVEAEFPNLGAARAAVNKTIVHPEKLTLSKAEHVAAKGNSR